MSQCELATYSAPDLLGFSSESVRDIGVGGRHTGYVTENLCDYFNWTDKRTDRQTDRRTDGWTDKSRQMIAVTLDPPTLCGEG